MSEVEDFEVVKSSEEILIEVLTKIKLEQERERKSTTSEMKTLL